MSQVNPYAITRDLESRTMKEAFDYVASLSDEQLSATIAFIHDIADKGITIRETPNEFGEISGDKLYGDDAQQYLNLPLFEFEQADRNRVD